jgi:formylglycine-generating enzyme required for sulfatase activity
VRQYEAFIEDDGYADDSLWDADGLAWRMGGFDGVALIGALSPRPAGSRRLPWRWADQRAVPARPVVGISWYEARAYAAWLDRQLRRPLAEAGLSLLKVRLPTELEWERAVRARSLQRAEARDWPWDREAMGSTTPMLLANIDVTRLGHSSTVGLFPPNPLGLFDLAGNAWEWMDNLLPSPDGPVQRIETGAPMRYLNGEISPHRGVSLRGGSWHSSLDEARCGVRVSRMPWEHDDTIGLRVALVPPPPSSAA